MWLEEYLEVDVAGGVTQFGQTAGLDLANSLSGRVDHIADIGQCPRLVAVKTEPKPQHLLFLSVENLECLDQAVPPPG